MAGIAHLVVNVAEAETVVQPYGIAELWEGLQIGGLVAQAPGRLQRFGKKLRTNAIASCTLIHIKLHNLAPALG